MHHQRPASFSTMTEVSPCLISHFFNCNNLGIVETHDGSCRLWNFSRKPHFWRFKLYGSIFTEVSAFVGLHGIFLVSDLFGESMFHRSFLRSRGFPLLNGRGSLARQD